MKNMCMYTNGDAVSKKYANSPFKNCSCSTTGWASFMANKQFIYADITLYLPFESPLQLWP